MDVRAAAAREHHQAAQADMESAGRHRAARDTLIRALREEDPARWTHTALGRVVGCSPELIAVILRGQR